MKRSHELGMDMLKLWRICKQHALRVSTAEMQIKLIWCNIEVTKSHIPTTDIYWVIPKAFLGCEILKMLI